MNILIFIATVLSVVIGNLCAAQLISVPIKKIPGELARDLLRGGGLSLVAITLLAYVLLVHVLGWAEGPGKLFGLFARYVAVGFLSGLVLAKTPQLGRFLEARTGK